MFPLFESAVSDTTCDLHSNIFEYSSFSFSEPIINNVNYNTAQHAWRLQTLFVVRNENDRSSKIHANRNEDYKTNSKQKKSVFQLLL